MRSTEADEVQHYLGAAIALALLAPLAMRLRLPVPRYVVYTAAALAIALAGGLLVMGDDLLLSREDIYHPFDVVLGAVNQVAHGRTVLVDTTSQMASFIPTWLPWRSPLSG